jgi:predicted nucleotidyltransferase
VTLLRAVTERLRAADVPFALIGAGALAVYGVTRGSRDLDLLVVDGKCLDRGFWDALDVPHAAVEIRSAGVDDPLGGMIRVTLPGQAIDVVVGRPLWQSAVLGATRRIELEGAAVPVVSLVDLILLKLYAGGPQDGWDIEQLLQSGAVDMARSEIDRRVGALPDHARDLWERLRRRP